MKQRTVNWSHAVCRLCEVPSSHPSQEDVNAFLHLGERLGERVRRFYMLVHSVPWIKSQGKGSRNQILPAEGTRSTRLGAILSTL